MNQLNIQISNEHYKNAYDFVLNCPLELAMKQLYPQAYIIVGAKTVVFIEFPKKDKTATIYSIPTSYNVKMVEAGIKAAKSGESFVITNLVLTKIGTHENYLLTDPKDDHMEKINLPSDLFT